MKIAQLGSLLIMAELVIAVLSLKQSPMYMGALITAKSGKLVALQIKVLIWPVDNLPGRKPDLQSVSELEGYGYEQAQAGGYR
jgi:hypothetical protein